MCKNVLFIWKYVFNDTVWTSQLNKHGKDIMFLKYKFLKVKKVDSVVSENFSPIWWRVERMKTKTIFLYNYNVFILTLLLIIYFVIRYKPLCSDTFINALFMYKTYSIAFKFFVENKRCSLKEIIKIIKHP